MGNLDLHILTASKMTMIERRNEKVCKHLCFEQETTTVDGAIRIHYKHLYFLVETSAWSFLTLI